MCYSTLINSFIHARWFRILLTWPLFRTSWIWPRNVRLANHHSSSFSILVATLLYSTTFSYHTISNPVTHFYTNHTSQRSLFYACILITCIFCHTQLSLPYTSVGSITSLCYYAKFPHCFLFASSGVLNKTVGGVKWRKIMYCINLFKQETQKTH